jgi:hypothetical protein
MPGAVHQVNVFVVPAATANEEISTIFLEFGLLILGLGIIARLARRWEISAVPFYLLAGLLFGEGGLSVVDSSDALVPTLAELGVILLLLLLGLEYSGDELVQTAQRQSRSGVIDLIANSVPGALVGFAFGCFGPCRRHVHLLVRHCRPGHPRSPLATQPRNQTCRVRSGP